MQLFRNARETINYVSGRIESTPMRQMLQRARIVSTIPTRVPSRDDHLFPTAKTRRSASISTSHTKSSAPN